MEGRDERDPGFDDWFDEPEAPQGRGTRVVFDDDDAWVVPESGAARARARRREPIVIAGRELGTAQLAIVGACVLAVFFAILAAAGVFNSPARHVAQPATTSTTPPPTVSPAVTTPTVPNPNSGLTKTLKPGDTGAQVTALQNALTKLGFSPGKADGTYGPATQVAVEHFQAANGLGVDGVVGPKTLAAIQKALGG
jgi:hypothetical protein